MKKLLIVLLMGIVPMVSFGRHHHGGFRPGPPPPMHRHGGYHHHGPGYFWGGVAAGALIGTALSVPYRVPACVPPPPPVPVVSTRVWIPARVETRYDSWGRPYMITIPGHWE